MPVSDMHVKSVDVRRLLDYKRTPPIELVSSGNIRIINMNPIKKDLLHVLIDIVYSLKGHKKDEALMDARLEIDVFYEGKEEEIVEMYKKWDKNQILNEDFYYEVGNSAFALFVYTVLPLSEKMNLPPVIELPAPIPPPKKTKTK